MRGGAGNASRRVVYLVVRLDIELDLLASESSDPVWTRNVSMQV